MGRKSRDKRSRKRVTSGSHEDDTVGSTGAPRAHAEPGEEASEAWYVARATRGEQLLGGGQVGEAREVFEAVLARLTDAPSYRRAVILGRLGRCSHAAGRPDLAVAQLRDALEVTARLVPSDGVKGLRGVLQAELGDALRALGRYSDARRAYESALEIAEAARDLRGQGVDLGQLGALALVEGRLEEARARYQAALRLFQQLHEPAMEAVAWHQLGRIFHARREWDEAERHYQEAARIREASGSLAGAAQAWSQVALLNQDAGRPDAAEGWYRKAIDVDRRLENPIQLGRHLGNLADLLKDRPGRLVEARQLAEEALVVLQSREPAAGEAWKTYGTLADVIDKEAATTADGQRRAALQAQARAYREVQRRAPPILAALAGLGEAPSHGRAVVLGRLGRCFHLGGRPDLALPHLRDAMGIAGGLAPSDLVKGLRGTLHSDVGDALLAIGDSGGARKAYEAAVEIAEELKDLWGQGVGLGQLGALAMAEGRLEEARARSQAALGLLQQLHEPAMEAAASHQLGRVFQAGQQWDEAERHDREAAHIREGRGDQAGAARGEVAAGEGTSLPLAFEVTVHEDEITDYGFEPDLLLDGRRERRITRWTGEPDPLADGLRPMLAPCARAWADDDGAVRFGLPPREPLIERQPGCIVMRRTRREVAVSGSPGVLWRLIRRMDGGCTVGEILAELPTGEREGAARLLAAMAATGALDVRGRPLARFLHSATKKGVLPGGGLGSDEVLRLATDESYRAYPGAPRLDVGQSVPDRLRPFYGLTRSRRSQRDYLGLPLRRDELDALLHTACGVTGATPWAGRELKLRAYPSSGALYAVEVYPVVFRVEGLEPAVYHYRAVESVLELVRPGLDRDRLVAAALPVEREMVAGAAVMVCLAGVFPRHERKYGEGGYRMLVAEAGHVSQNLILAATALGLSARPFGGVFDDLLNEDLGLDVAEEQFLLAVLVGHAGGRQWA